MTDQLSRSHSAVTGWACSDDSGRSSDLERVSYSFPGLDIP